MSTQKEDRMDQHREVLRLKKGCLEILRITVFDAPYSGNFSSTTTEKSSFLNQWSGSDFEIIENLEKYAESTGKLEGIQRNTLLFLYVPG